MCDFHKSSREKRCLPAIIAPAENGCKGTTIRWKVHQVWKVFRFQFSVFNFQIICIFAPLNFLE